MDRLQASGPATLASPWLSAVLALEVAAAGRSPCPTGRRPKSRSTDQSREPALGRAAYPWRVAQARHRDRSIFRCQVHGATTWAAVTRLVPLHSQSNA